MQSAVETLSPTRVKLTVEVTFDELKADLDKAYKAIGSQVKVQGFRPGKVPPRILDQRVGRGAVLDEAVSHAIPRLYGVAVEAESISPVAQPDIDVTNLADGDSLTFTAEVDVRPEIELPAYDAIAVSVDPVELTDAIIDEQIDGLRERFASLTPVERPAANGDFVTLDLAATIDGEEVPGGTATGLSYEVGGGELLDGIDAAVTGASAGDAMSFQTVLVAGELEGKTADVAVTVRSVNERELPAADDQWASTAAGFDTLAELRDDVRGRIDRAKRLEQGIAARDQVLAALLASVEVPLPQSVVDSEVAFRRKMAEDQFSRSGLSLQGYLEHEDKTEEQFEADLLEGAQGAVKAQFVLDAVAEKEELGVNEAELTDQLVRQAARAGVTPEVYAQTIVQSGQLNGLVAEVRRGKALMTVMQAATITDTTGVAIDLEALRDDALTDSDVETDEDGRRYHVHQDGEIHHLD